MAIRDALNAATADSRITTDEWTRFIKPHADFSPKGASEEAREVLCAWADDAFQLEDGAAEGMRRYLQSRGYAVPAERPAGDPAAVDRILGSNVSEADRDFAALAERSGKSGSTVAIAVLDNGFDTRHVALFDKLWTNAGEVAGDGQDNDGNGRVDDIHGWDFVDGDADASGQGSLGHGTHVAGIATAGTAQIDTMALRTYSPLSGEKVAEAIDYAAANGARVVNISFQVDSAVDKGLIVEAMRRHPEVLFVKSAGNDGKALEGYDDAAYLAKEKLPNLAVVASSNADGTLSGFSNFGEGWATQAAPGADVVSALPGNQFAAQSGTSMSAPRVANAAAKMLILDPALTPAQVQAMLAETSDRCEDWSQLTASGGVINAGTATRLAALTGLVRGGATVEGAAAQLELDETERARLLPLAEKFLVS